MRFLRILGLAVLICSVSISRAADPEPPERKWDGSPGFSRFPGTLSPDSAYEYIWLPSSVKPEERASLKEWPADLVITSELDSFDNFLYDAAHHRLLTQLPEFDFYEGHGYRKNRGELYVAWAPDSRSGLVICEERWDDLGILWVEPAANKVHSVKDAMEKAYGKVLLTREKDRNTAMQFSEPAILPGGILVVDGNAGHEKEGPYYTYRLTFRVHVAKGKAQLELIKARKITDKEQREHEGGSDYDPDLNRFYGKLRARLDDKGKAALKKEEETWLQWRDAQPKEFQEKLTMRRAVELRARLEN